MTALDLVYLRPDRTLSVGADPVALAVNPRLNEVYVVNRQPGQANGTITVIDTMRNQTVASVTVHREPSAIAVDATGQRAFVVNTGSNTVSVLDLDSRRVLDTRPTGNHPGAVAISPDGRTLVVTNLADGSVTVFGASIPPAPTRPALGTSMPASPVTSTAPLTLRATFAGCAGATSPVILPDSSRAFIACSTGHQVMGLSLAAAPDSWAARQDASLTTDHPLAMLNVGESPMHLTLKPDGGQIFVSNYASDSISEISTTNAEVGSTYGIGNHPTHGVVSADNSALWVATTGADAISLYSIDDGKFLSSLRTGTAPDALTFSSDPAQTFLLAADTKSGDVSVIRTSGKLGPSLLTILPAGGTPSAIVTKISIKQ